MRPSLLDPLFASVSTLSGVGPKSALLYDRLLAPPGGAARLVDLLFHVPYDAIDRRARPKIVEAEIGTQVVLDVRVTEHRPPGGRYAKGPYRVHVEDDTGDVQLVFFMANASWIEKSLPIGARRFVSGRLELYDGYRQIVHPDRVLDAESVRNLAPVEPVYGATEPLRARWTAPWSACRRVYPSGSMPRVSPRRTFQISPARSMRSTIPASQARLRRTARLIRGSLTMSF